MPESDPYQEARRLREHALRARQGLGVVVERLRAEREVTRRALVALYRTAAGVSTAVEGTAIAAPTSPPDKSSATDDLSNRGKQDRRRRDDDDVSGAPSGTGRRQPAPEVPESTPPKGADTSSPEGRADRDEGASYFPAQISAP